MTWYECDTCPFVTVVAEIGNEHEDKTGHLVMVSDR